MMMTREYLDEHPDVVFVFGDNTIRRGTGGAAALRDHPQSYGFITKRRPNNLDSSFFTPDDYPEIFEEEMSGLIAEIESHPQKRFMISKLGGGLANRYRIHHMIIAPRLKQLAMQYSNVELMYESSKPTRE